MTRDLDDMDAIRRFVLNVSPDGERDRIEDQLIDPAFAEAVAAVEEELIVLHLQHKLPPDLRAPFRAAFLETESGLQQVRDAEALRALLSGSTAARPVAGAGARRRFVPFMAAAAALAVVITGAAIYTNRTVSPTGNDPPVSKPPGAVEPPTFQLRAGQTRAAAEPSVFRVPAGVSAIRLQLALAAAGATDVRVTLRRIGEEPLPISNLPDVSPEPQAIRVRWMVPASVLTRGDYLLTATGRHGPNPRETIGTSFFSIE